MRAALAWLGADAELVAAIVALFEKRVSAWKENISAMESSLKKKLKAEDAKLKAELGKFDPAKATLQIAQNLNKVSHAAQSAIDAYKAKMRTFGEDAQQKEQNTNTTTYFLCSR